MVLNNVANDAKLIKIASTTLSPKWLLHTWTAVSSLQTGNQGGMLNHRCVASTLKQIWTFEIYSRFQHGAMNEL